MTTNNTPHLKPDLSDSPWLRHDRLRKEGKLKNEDGWRSYETKVEQEPQETKRRFSWSKLTRRFTPGQIVLMGFLMICVGGGLLLTLPCMNAKGVWTPFIDALFTATSATCVTGLVVLDTGTYWNLLGQIVVILLIQVGGLGFMSMMSIFFLAFRRRVTIHERQIIQSAVNADRLSGIMGFVKKILVYAFSIEAIGGLLLCFVFVPQFGWSRGIYYGLWHSISMYCNAGFDLMGGFNSFVQYVENPVLNITVCLLIVIGGIGFAVYGDIETYIRQKIKFRKVRYSEEEPHRIHTFSMNTKLVLITTAILVFGGAFLFFMFEKDNPGTMRDLTPAGKIYASFFQAITPRTAGANTIDQAHLTQPSLLLTDILMLIGGSPGSTAGGIKTTCIAVMFITLWSILMGKRRVNCMGREIPTMTIRQALCVFVIAICVVIFTVFILLFQQPGMSADSIFFEVFSAFDTVGLTTGITRGLTGISKFALILDMYIGRVGPMTIAAVITSQEKREREEKGQFKLPDGTILIG